MKEITAHIKASKHLVTVFVLAAATIAFYFWFSHSSLYEGFVAWSDRNFWLYFGTLVFFKALAIVWPPLPGGLFTFGSVPVIGWGPAFSAQVIGGLIGGSIAYFLGRRYGFSLLSILFDESVIDRIRKVKIYKHREFEAIFFLRMFTTSVSEAVSYCSGLIGIKYHNFFLATFCGFIFELPLFYLASSILAGKNIFLSGALFLVAGFVFYKLKGRYFE